MTDAPLIMPHPDDPPPGSKSPRAARDTEPQDDELTVIIPTRIEGDTSQDSWGSWAVGAGGLAAALMLVQYTVGGVPLVIPAVITGVTIYCGVRGVMAARRGLASKTWAPVLGLAAGGVALLAILVHYLVIAPALEATTTAIAAGL